MLEIVALVILCSTLGKKLRAKGRKPLGYQIALVLLWFSAEVVAAIVYFVVIAIQNGGQEPEFSFGVWACSIIAAACSAGAMFLLVQLLPSTLAPDYHPEFSQSFPNGDDQNYDSSPDPDAGNPYRSPRN